MNTEKQQFKPYVMLIDADCLDGVAAEMRRMFTDALERDIPRADLAEWLVCAALDGHVPEDAKGESQNELQVIFIRQKERTTLEHFLPSGLVTDIDGQAFRDEVLGEFLLSVVPEEKELGQVEPLMVESLRYLLSCKEIKRLVVVPDMQRYGALLREAMGQGKEGPEVVVLKMDPTEVPHAEVQVLGYSLLVALGITYEELQGRRQS